MNKRDLHLPSAPWPYAVQARVNPKGRTGTFWCVVDLMKGHNVRIGPMVKGEGAADWAGTWAGTLYDQRLSRQYGVTGFVKVKEMRCAVKIYADVHGWEVIR